jgi:hypothetical protein
MHPKPILWRKMANKKPRGSGVFYAKSEIDYALMLTPVPKLIDTPPRKASCDTGICKAGLLLVASFDATILALFADVATVLFLIVSIMSIILRKYEPRTVVLTFT